MKKILFPFIMILFVSFSACDTKAKQAEEMDKKEAVKVDSMNTELGKANDELTSEGDQLEKEVDDLLKD